MTPESAHKFGAALRAIRMAQDLSANEVARRAGVDPGTVVRIELGQILSPKPESLSAVAQVLGMSKADIFAMAGWITPADLPELQPYMRAKYRDMPPAALQEMTDFLDDFTKRYSLQSPVDGEDEY